MEVKTNVSDAIMEITVVKGISVLSKPEIFCAMLDDIAPIAISERKIIRRCLDDNTAQYLIEGYNSTPEHRSHVLKILNQYLEDNLGILEEWREVFLISFICAFSWEYNFAKSELSMEFESDNIDDYSPFSHSENREKLESLWREKEILEKKMKKINGPLNGLRKKKLEAKIDQLNKQIFFLE